jgi:hypothetical protein
MKILSTYYSDKGGINNVSCVIVVNERLETVKAFRSRISIEKAMKRAKSYINREFKTH